LLFLIQNGRGSTAAVPFEQCDGAQPSLWAQPHRHPNSKDASSPLWMAMRQQWLIFGGDL